MREGTMVYKLVPGMVFLALRSPVSDRILNSRCKVGLSQIAKSAGKLSIPYNFKMNK
jgi:hypothetical protein